MQRPGVLYRWALCAVLLAVAPALSADTAELERRLERLEAQMERLIRQLEGRQEAPAEPPPERTPAPPDVPAASPAAPAQTPAAAPAAAAPPARAGEVRLRYFLSSDPMGDEPPADGALADGLFALDGDLRMDPFRYGAAERRILGGSYQDPSLTRAVGILMEGWLDVPRSGAHRFELTPKPAREGGDSSASNQMSIRLWVAGEPVLELDDVRSWRRRQIERTLSAGRHPFRLWVVSNSPGFGASPVDSRLGMEVVMPGRAELTPLWRQLSAPESLSGQ